MNVIVTGSFDPITVGHIDIISKIADKYEKIYVVALINEAKQYMFTMEQKKKLMELSLSDFSNVVVDAYDGLTADYMHEHDIYTIIRGIRNDDDLAYETELAMKMKEFDEAFSTVLIKADEKYSEISSTIVKERILKRKSIQGLVHPNAEKAILECMI